MERIPLDQVGYDPKYYPRVNGHEDWLTVHRYKDALLADRHKDFPPVVVVKATGKPYKYMLLDGKHRCKSYALAERGSIPAEVERLPESKWFARSVELNATHGRTLDSGDKAWIAKRLEEDGYSTEDAAKLLHMRVESLEKIKAEHAVKMTATVAKKLPFGRSHRQLDSGHFGFLKAPFKDFAGSASAESVLAAQAPVSSGGVLNVLDSAIAVLECGVDMADERIVERVEKLRALLPAPVLN